MQNYSQYRSTKNGGAQPKQQPSYRLVKTIAVICICMMMILLVNGIGVFDTAPGGGAIARIIVSMRRFLWYFVPIVAVECLFTLVYAFLRLRQKVQDSKKDLDPWDPVAVKRRGPQRRLPPLGGKGLIALLLCFQLTVLCFTGIDSLAQWLYSLDAARPVSDAQSVPETALPDDAPAGYWYMLHEGEAVLIRSATEVYGYNELTPAGQQAFDVFYGLYFAEGVMRRDEGTHSFVLPQPLSTAEYKRVQALWQSNMPWPYLPLRYATDSTDNITKVYAGYTGFSDKEGYWQVFWAAADDILAGMPQGMAEAQQVEWLALYLAQHTRLNSTQRTGGADLGLESGITVGTSVPSGQTGYGTLVNGWSNATGYMQALHALCYKAGIYSIPVAGTVNGEGWAWNMVRLDGDWYHVDVASMSTYDGVDTTFLLANDVQIAATHIAVSYWDVDFVPLPAATGVQYTPVSTVEPPARTNTEMMEAYTTQRAAVPYSGRVEYEAELSHLPVLYEGQQTEALQQAINAYAGGNQIVNLWHYDKWDNPSMDFILYAAARHTQPVVFEEVGLDFADVLGGAKGGILQEHLEQTARALFGEDVQVEHGIITDSPLSGLIGEGYWMYDALYGVYLPVQPAIQGTVDLVLLDYIQKDDTYLAVLAPLHYNPAEGGYKTGLGVYAAPSDVGRLLSEAKSSGERYVAVAQRQQDGSFQLTFLGLPGQYPGYEEGTITIIR